MNTYYEIECKFGNEQYWSRLSHRFDYLIEAIDWIKRELQNKDSNGSMNCRIIQIDQKIINY